MEDLLYQGRRCVIPQRWWIESPVHSVPMQSRRADSVRGEPDHSCDRFAVMVLHWNGEPVGYLPSEVAGHGKGPDGASRAGWIGDTNTQPGWQVSAKAAIGTTA
jgi:hypothetical protein